MNALIIAALALAIKYALLELVRTVVEGHELTKKTKQ